MNRLPAGGSGTISGRVVNMHMSRPRDNPVDYTMHAGHPLAGCWIGLNSLLAGAVGDGLYAKACNDDSTFSISGVPDGTYQLVMWDTYLDNIFASQSVTITNGVSSLGAGTPDIPVFRWYGAHEHWVFNDNVITNGMRDPGEAGIPDQVINFRYRDGSIYQTSTTDTRRLPAVRRDLPVLQLAGRGSGLRPLQGYRRDHRRGRRRRGEG